MIACKRGDALTKGLCAAEPGRHRGMDFPARVAGDPDKVFQQINRIAVQE